LFDFRIDRRSGLERRVGQRRSADRRAELRRKQAVNLDLILKGIAIRRSGEDRRQGDRRNAERRGKERREDWLHTPGLIPVSHPG
jgi:hypothetical protein